MRFKPDLAGLHLAAIEAAVVGVERPNWDTVASDEMLDAIEGINREDSPRVAPVVAFGGDFVAELAPV